MTGRPDMEAFVAAFKAEIVDLYKDNGSNFVADGGDYLIIDATLWNDDLRDLFERVFMRLDTQQG